MKNSNDTMGNRTRDLPACSAVPQPTAPPREENCYTFPKFPKHQLLLLYTNAFELSHNFMRGTEYFLRRYKRVLL